MFFGLDKKRELPKAEDALPGREATMPIENIHYVNRNPIKAPFPEDTEQIIFALGCFWGAERLFWQLPGVYTTAVGYINGFTPNPSYEEVCSGMTGHTEAVLVVYDPDEISLEALLTVFWESHDPTQGMRQGNDTGTQYRSGIYVFNYEEKNLVEASKSDYQNRLNDAGYPAITTEVLMAPEFYYAEQYHQQYLAKNPAGYCGLAGTGVSCSAK
jgi:peptide-methionine (S)-S-oxide reductase